MKIDIHPEVESAVTLAEALLSLARHFNNDWGAITQQERALNQSAYFCNGRLISVYPLLSGEKLIILNQPNERVIRFLLA